MFVYLNIILHKIAIFGLQSVDLTELAKQGKLDPTIGREEGTKLFLTPFPLPHFSLQKFAGLYKVSDSLFEYLMR
jgi:hypothetical protein